MCYTSYILQKKSYHSWQMVGCKHEHDVKLFTLERFHKYFFWSMRIQKKQGIIIVEKRYMIMVQCEANFTELAKFESNIVENDKSQSPKSWDIIKVKKEEVIQSSTTTRSSSKRNVVADDKTQ